MAKKQQKDPRNLGEGIGHTPKGSLSISSLTSV